uniref:Uncharacterized protein n=1 Tax=Tetraselmis sp. GSL018 TaxID=582737 RepID=A0A061SAJ7_9CHLO
MSLRPAPCWTSPAASSVWVYDYSGARSPVLEAKWKDFETDWEWGYPEQQQQVAGLMEALLPKVAAGGGSLAGGDSEFQEVAPRRSRRRDQDMELGGAASEPDEFHCHSPFASKVPEAVMRRLQQLHLEGCRLAEKLDDRAWSALAALSVEDGLRVIEQVSGQLSKPSHQIRNTNAVLMSHAGKYLREHGKPKPDHAALTALPPPPPKAAAPKKATQRAAPHSAKRNSSDLSTLPQGVQSKAKELMEQFKPYLTPEHFDPGIVSVLKQMGDANAQIALEAVKASCSGRGARDWSKLDNPSAYIMSIISPYIRRAR